ncbi:MAG: GDSL-type esterase/lipase family protein [Actinomycetota bacterium]|nr:GDSL-type esterase/lipase family protein [Actinomycetota bacterium]
MNDGPTGGQGGRAPVGRVRAWVGRRPRTVAVSVLSLVTVAAVVAAVVVLGAPITAAGRPLMPPGGRLLAGQSLDDGGYTLALAPDGRLTARDPGGAVLWTGGAPGPSGATLTMQRNGELVERDAAGEVVWRSGTAGAGDCLLGDQTTGTPIVYRGSSTTPTAWPIWSVAPCYLGDRSKTRVAVVGDSIVFVSQPDIEAVLDRRAATMVSGQVGWTIAQQQAAVVTDLDNPDGPPADWIVDLGTNDAVFANRQWRPAYDAMVASLAGQSCVLLTTVSSEADAMGGTTIGAAIDRAERATVASHPNFHLVDWNAAVHQGSHLRTWLMDDRIHPNRAGQQALAAMYLGALEHQCHLAAAGLTPG